MPKLLDGISSERTTKAATMDTACEYVIELLPPSRHTIKTSARMTLALTDEGMIVCFGKESKLRGREFKDQLHS